MNGIVVLIKEAPENSLPLSPGEDTAERPLMKNFSFFLLSLLEFLLLRCLGKKSVGKSSFIFYSLAEGD